MTESTQRLFVAVAPPEHVLEHLEEAVAPMRRNRPDLSWVSERRLHVTVAFMPHVPNVVADGLPDVVASAVERITPFRLSVARSGFFDEHVLWAGLGDDVESLKELASGVVRAAASTGADPEQRRAFRPHLSLARGKGRLDAHLDGLAAQLDAYAGPTWLVDEVRLVRSHLGRAPHHEMVAVLALGGDAPPA